MNTLGPRVLLVEDTPEIALWLATALRQSGMAVDLACDGHQAEAMLPLGHGFDAVLLDLQLPGLDGLTVLQRLRQRHDTVPVLVLTARASVPDRVLGLNLGADDYLPKPFDLSELEARLQALLRRPGRTVGGPLRLGALQMERTGGQAQWQGRPLALTPRESAALRALLESPRRAVSKEELHERVFSGDAAGLDAVEVLIHRLRKKLENLCDDPAQCVRITTYRGMGYMLSAAVDAS